VRNLEGVLKVVIELLERGVKRLLKMGFM